MLNFVFSFADQEQFFDFNKLHTNMHIAEPPFTGFAGILSRRDLVHEGTFAGEVITDHPAQDSILVKAAAAAITIATAPSAAPLRTTVKLAAVARTIGGRRYQVLRGVRFRHRILFVALAGRAPPQRWHGQSNGLSRSPSAGPRLGRGHSFPLKSQWGAKRVEKEARKSRNRCER